MNAYLKLSLIGLVGGLIGGFLVVLVFGGKSVQTIIRETGENIADLGARGTSFANGLMTDFVTFPYKNADSSFGLESNTTVRRCQIASGSDSCSLTNYSSVDWIIRPRLWLTGATTNTRAKFFVSTSTLTSLSGSWWNGVGSSSLKHAPISLGVSTTSFPFGDIPNGFGTTSAVSSVTAGTYPAGLFILRNGDSVHCGVTIGAHKTGDVGYWEKPTSTNFVYRGNCSYEIVATSTPDSTPTR